MTYYNTLVELLNELQHLCIPYNGLAQLKLLRPVVSKYDRVTNNSNVGWIKLLVHFQEKKGDAHA